MLVNEKRGAPGERDAGSDSIIKMHPKLDKAFLSKDFSKKRKNATLADHRVWGRNLRIIRNGLVAIEVDVAKACGTTNARKYANRLSKAAGLIDEARSDLENIMMDECRDELLHFSNNAVLSIYYGGSEPSSQNIYDEVHEHGRKRDAENAERQHEQILKRYGRG